VTRVLLVVMLLLAALAPAVSAQSSWVEGRVTDGKEPLSFVVITCTDLEEVVFTDYDGQFRFQAPARRQFVTSMAMGYRSVQRTITVGPGDTTRVSIVLDAMAMGAWDYPESTFVVRGRGMEFFLRYVLVEAGDSVVVTVVAEGRNVLDTPITEEACFSFSDARFRRAPDHLNCIRLTRTPSTPDSVLFPMLEVPPLECDEAREGEWSPILPGELISRSMTFSFFPNAFRDWPGELHVQCVFTMAAQRDQLKGAGPNAGARPWAGAWSFDIGTIKIPIRPIGMPIDLTCPW
jgi:hypothetical protein